MEEQRNSELTTNKCPYCGTEVHPKENFCHNCGKIITKRTLCARCFRPVPDDVRFCPHCGNDFRSHWLRRVLWAVLILAVVAGGLALCYRDQIAKAFEKASSAVATVDEVELKIDNDQAAAIVKQTLNRENRLGGQETIVFAEHFDAKGDDMPEYIIGIAVHNDAHSLSYYRFYRLAPNEDKQSWHTVDYTTSKQFTDQSLSFDVTELVANPSDVLKLSEIGGNRYLSYAFCAMPMVPSYYANGQVTFALFNIDSKDVVAADYVGRLVNKDDKEKVRGVTNNRSNSEEAVFLRGLAATSPKIYIPTAEDLELEKPENASVLWVKENQKNIQQILEGKSVRLSVMLYEHPLFDKSRRNNDTFGSIFSSALEFYGDEVIENGLFVVSSTTQGIVYGYNKKNKKYFVLYAPNSSKAPQCDVYFNNDGSLHITARDVSYNVSLADFTARQSAQ